MRLPIKARHVPARLATGAFILNSGLSKRGLGREAAESYHGMAKTAYPFLGELDAQDFTRMLSTAEIAVGTTLLLPMVPTALAGAALAGFSGGLVGLYLRVPGMRQEGSLRPTEKGVPLAKDWWMLGIGLGFLIDGLFDRGK